MVLLLYFVCFVAKFLLIQCEYNITVQVLKTNEPCNVNSTYTIHKGETVNIYYQNNNMGPGNGTAKPYVLEELTMYYKGQPNKLTKKAPEINADEGIIMPNYTQSLNTTKITFGFKYLKGSPIVIANNKTSQDKDYAESKCSTLIKLSDAVITTTEQTVPPGFESYAINSSNTTDNKTTGNPGKVSEWVYAGAAIGALVVITMVGQTAGIMYFKAKAAKLDRDKSLSERPNLDRSDRARYSTMPGQKGMKIPALAKDREEDRESKIYETVNINTTEIPPQPPAISTLPRLPRNHRPDETQTHLAPPTPAMALRGMIGLTPHASPMTGTRDRDLPKPSPATPISRRPPIPLPTEDALYEDITLETEAAYEPAPIHDAQPPRTPVVKNVRKPIPVPPKPVDRRANPDVRVQRPQPPPKTKKPPVQTPVASELDSILQKRRNVLQAPVSGADTPKSQSSLTKPMIQAPTQSIPVTSIPKNNAPMTKPKPPPPVVRKPVMQPPAMEDSEPCYEEYYDSSDDEWTYEPLKPMDPHIYNI